MTRASKKDFSSKIFTNEALLTGSVITSEDGKNRFVGSVIRSDKKREFSFDLKDCRETLDLTFSNVRIIESFGEGGTQKYIIGYGIIQNINLYGIGGGKLNDSNSRQFTVARVGVYADETQNHPSTVFDTSSGEPTVMIKVSASEFDRLMSNFQSNMFCKLSLEGTPIYKLDGDVWATPIGQKIGVEKKTKFEFQPSAKFAEISDDIISPKLIQYNVDGADDKEDDYEFLNPLSAYLPVVKSVILRRLFLIPFLISFIVAYGSLNFFK